ncbi:MAG: hypothetical protein IKI75_08890 [Lachnospiraceae bacterium]|nr:hypothetical protein [Lachnospiraceae bacterium]
MNDRTRHSEIDLYKGLGIIFVMIYLSGMAGGWFADLTAIICFPLVMTAAGASQYVRGYEESNTEMFKHGLVRGLLPYLWFSVIFLLIDALGMFIAPERFGINGLYINIYETLTLTGIGVLWFYPVFTVSTLVWRLFRKDVSFPWMGGSVTFVCVAMLCIFHIRGFDAAFIFEETEPGLNNVLMRLSCLLWLSAAGIFFCFWGELCCRLSVYLKKHKFICVIAAFTATAAGGVLCIFTGETDIRLMRMGNPLITLPAMLLLSGGLYILCGWIRTIRGIEELGRYAVIIYPCFACMGLTELALGIGGKVFAATMNNFACRACVTLVMLAFAAVLILILRLKPFAFLFGHRSFKAPGVQEEE